MSKADNMLSILWLLKSEKRVTAKQLADTLEINIRTVYRYIDALCASGVPIIADSGHNGGYSLHPSFTEAPLFFNLDEQKALVHAAMFAKEAGYPFGGVLNQAISKLKMYTNEEQLNQITRHEEGLSVISTPSNLELEEILQELEVSVAERFTLSMDYLATHDSIIRTRHVDPYGLVHWKNNWYIVAFCHLRQDIRSFRVDRIRSVARTETVFQRPKEFSARQFLLQNVLPDPEKQENLVSVRLEGKERVIKDLSGHWLFGHLLEECSKNHLQFQLQEGAVMHYAPYILLSYGKSVKVLEPLSLKKRMIELTTELLKYYQMDY